LRTPLRSSGTSLANLELPWVYLCAHEEFARRWNREGFGATANPAKSRSAPHLRWRRRASLCRNASGSITVQPTASRPSRRCVRARRADV